MRRIPGSGRIVCVAFAALMVLQAAQGQNREEFVLRTGPDLHQALSVRAMIEGESLNTFVVKTLRKGLSA